MTTRDAALAWRIADTLGLRPNHVRAVRDQGRVNHVFVVRCAAVAGAGERCVVRFALDPLRGDGYAVEAWCLVEAARHGIPGPEVVAVGTLDDVPYLVESYVDGVAGTMGGLAEWRTLGSYGRVVHAIPVTAEAPDGLFSRFGRDPAAAWRAHLSYNVGELNPSDPLIELGVYEIEVQPLLLEVMSRLGANDVAFGLSHGDLSLRNLLLPGDGPPVLLDWDTAAVGPVPETDLLSLLRMHQGEDYPDRHGLEAFADGYGVVLDDVLPALTDQLVLAHLDVVRWARERRPDLLPETAAAARTGVARNLRGE